MLADYRFLRTSFANRVSYDELLLSEAWRDAVYASVSLSPNVGLGPSPKSWAISSDLVGHLPLAHGFSITTGIGYGDVRQEVGSGVLYGNAGLTYQYRSVQFDIMYVATRVSETLRAKLGKLVVNRWVADFIFHF